MSEGGFTGDPAAAFDVSGAAGCCGNAPQTTVTLPQPAGAGPCCGTPAQAQGSGSCCGAGARAEAVSSGAGCCG